MSAEAEVQAVDPIFVKDTWAAWVTAAAAAGVAPKVCKPPQPESCGEIRKKPLIAEYICELERCSRDRKRKVD